MNFRHTQKLQNAKKWLFEWSNKVKEDTKNVK